MHALRPRLRIELSDAVTKTLAVIFAGACGIFAGYMILRLQVMENPPADLGLNFPEKSLKIEPQPVLVDPTPINSISAPDDAPAPDRPAVQPYRTETPVLKYRLLSVFDGIAFVEVTDLKGVRLQPVSIGAELQGAGTVEAVQQIDGRWQVVAGGRVVVGSQ